MAKQLGIRAIRRIVWANIAALTDNTALWDLVGDEIEEHNEELFDQAKQEAVAILLKRAALSPGDQHG